MEGREREKRKKTTTNVSEVNEPFLFLHQTVLLFYSLMDEYSKRKYVDSYRKYAYRECLEIYQFVRISMVKACFFLFFFNNAFILSIFSIVFYSLSFMSRNQNLNFQSLRIRRRRGKLWKYFHLSLKKKKKFNLQLINTCENRLCAQTNK